MSRRHEQKADAVQALVDRDAEREVLGACMVQPKDFDAVCDEVSLEAGDFATQRHQLIFAAMLQLRSDGVQVDLQTIRDVLQQRGQWERVGAQALGEALDRQGYAWHGVWSAKRLKRIALQRRTLAEEDSLRAAIAQSDHDAAGKALQRVGELRDEAIRLELEQDEDGWKDEVCQAVEDALNPQPLDFIPTGISFLDEHFGGGAERGMLIVVMAPAKVGKTALAMNTMAVAAAKANKAVLGFSFEMPKRDHVRRFLARESKVPVRAQKRGDLTDHQRVLLTDAGDVVARWPIDIESRGSSIDTLRAIVRTHKRRKALDVVVVDYIQLMSNGIQNLAQDIAATTRGLKLMAMEEQVLVIALSQPTNDEAKLGEIGLFSGKGSGSIAADCDAMLIPWRDKDDPAKAGLKLVGGRQFEAHTWPLGSLVFDGARMVFREPHVRAYSSRQYTEEVA